MKVVQISKTPDDNFTENNQVSQPCDESFERPPKTLIPKTDEKVINDAKKQKSPNSCDPYSANKTFAEKKQIPLPDEKNSPDSPEPGMIHEPVLGEDNKKVKADSVGENKQTSD